MKTWTYWAYMNQQITAALFHPSENSCIMFRIIFRVLCKKRGYWTIEILLSWFSSFRMHSWREGRGGERLALVRKRGGKSSFRKLLLSFMLWINWILNVEDFESGGSEALGALNMLRAAANYKQRKGELCFFRILTIEASYKFNLNSWAPFTT